MKRRQIDLFFKVLDAELGQPADVILVGASAGSLMGHVRPSFDIDFEIRGKGAGRAKIRMRMGAAVAKASQIAGVAANYSENVAGWSRVNYLDYRRTALPYKKIGRLKVKIIAPEYWTIGKMARFLELDIQDMIKIIKSKKIRPEALIRVWAKALLLSDLSLELGQFRDHVLYFLKKYGHKIWGKAFDFKRISDLFRKGVGPEHFKPES